MINALEKFLEDAVALGKLTDDYILSHRFLGLSVVNIIRTWEHYGVLP